MRNHCDPPGPLLQAGRHGLSRGRVASIQRGRILAAAADVVGEAGYSSATIAEIIARARVSRKTFYDIFTGWDECFLYVFDAALSRARLLARDAYTQEQGWRDGIRAALIQLLLFFDEEPALARILITEPFAAGGAALERRAAVLRDLVAVLELGRTGSTKAPSVLTAEGLIGGVVSVVHARILDGATNELTSLSGELMSMIVLPYHGTAAAKRELRRPRPKISRKAPRPRLQASKDPLAGLEMRLTYRTMQVLESIRQLPGANNRRIGEAAGIPDQGQISKLLARLERLGLVENLGEGQSKGGANAWHLTSRGAQLERSTRVY